jgi:hypothetical protein
VARFSGASDDSIRIWIARALVNKALSAPEVGQIESARAASDQVVERFADAGRDWARDAVAKALNCKAILLGRTGRFPEEVAVYADLVARFRHTADRDIQSIVAQARNNWRFRRSIATRSTVRFSTPTTSATFVRVPSLEACVDNGWHFDDAQNPKHLVACPGACNVIKATAEANIDLLLGCATLLPK